MAFVFLVCAVYDQPFGQKLTFAALARMCYIAGVAIIWPYAIELFPTEIRVMANGSCAEVGRMGGFVAPYLFDSSASLWTQGGVIFAVSVVTALSSSRLPETKGTGMGLALEEETPQVFQEAQMSQSKRGGDVMQSKPRAIQPLNNNINT